MHRLVALEREDIRHWCYILRDAPNTAIFQYAIEDGPHGSNRGSNSMVAANDQTDLIERRDFRKRELWIACWEEYQRYRPLPFAAKG